MFLDTRNNGRRGPCRMAVCGNAAKVRNFRAQRVRHGQKGERRDVYDAEGRRPMPQPLAIMTAGLY
jgi:hypothetical protein